MGQAMVRISEQSRETLREIAHSEHAKIQAVLEKAIEEYRRKRYIEDLNASYEALRQDPEAWKAEQEERALWDQTLGDGLPQDEIWDPVNRTVRIAAGEKTK